MKNKVLWGGCCNGSPHANQSVKLRRLATAFMLAGTMFANATNVNSQNDRVNINVKKGSLSEVLSEIESQTDYLFVYNNKVDVNITATVNAKEETVSVVLEKVLKGTNIDWRLEGQHIILAARDEVHRIAQQEKTITGVVLDENGEPVIGANVTVKGTTNGTITDMDGNFSLIADPKLIIEVSYIGYLTQNVVPGKQNSLKVILKEDTKRLDEVVVIGYGVQKKINLTGSVSSIGTKELTERPQPNVQNIIQGKIPGLQIVSNSAHPGRDSGNITIRGKGSFGASSDPLILIDGIIGSLSSLTSDDIESINVLKEMQRLPLFMAQGRQMALF